MLSFKDLRLSLLLTSFISFNLPTISESIDISLSIANAPINARGIVTPTIANQILIVKILLMLSFKDLRLSLLLTSFILFNCSTTLFNTVIFFEISISLEDMNASILKYIKDDIKTFRLSFIFSMLCVFIVFIELTPSATVFNISIFFEISISLEDISTNILKYIEDVIKAFRLSFKFSILFKSIDSIEFIPIKALFNTFIFSSTSLLDFVISFKLSNILDNEYIAFHAIVDLIANNEMFFKLILEDKAFINFN